MIFIFDLYDTVLKNISFDFNKGILYLYETFFTEKCTLKEMTDYAETFLPLYDKRKIDHKEICLIKDEIALYFEKFSVPKPDDFETLDYEIMNCMQKVTLLDDVGNTLCKLKELGIDMYILSNSIFIGDSAKKLLNEFEILHYFENVFSSADYGIRKPSRGFFEIALTEILSDNSGIEKEDIWYIGNDYDTDVIGATEAGLKTVWYNVEHFPNRNNLEIFEIDNFRDLIQLLKGTIYG